MFAIFKRKSKEDKLYQRYKRLLLQSHRLNTSSRSESEKKYIETQEVLKQIENLRTS